MRAARMLDPSPTTRRTQAERTARTRGALLAAARDLFAEQGYAATGREDIAARAGVTRGALYHHFASKAEVAEAVLSQVEAELVDRVVTAARRGATGYEQLRRGCLAYLDACAEPAIARILADAPAVLGVQAGREAGAETCRRLLGAALVTVARDGVDVPGDPEVTASLLLGMLNEAATLIASSPHPAAARRRVRPSVDRVLGTLFVSGPSGPAGP